MTTGGMRILLTGSDGQVGARLVRALAPLGDVEATTIETLDLGDFAAVRAVVADRRPDLVVNAAAYTNVDGAESEPDLAATVNAEAPAALAEAAAACGSAMVHYSTDYVFDGTKTGPYAPDDAPGPVSVYGRTKLAGEEAVRASGASCLVLRTAWVYDVTGRNFLRTMLRLADEREEIGVVDDQAGCPTWARVIADATAAMIDAALRRDADGASFGDRSGLWHLTCRGSTTWHGFAAEILRLARPPRAPRLRAITTADYPTPARRPPNSILDCTATEQAFGIRLPDWKDALAEALGSDDRGR
ncbi:MAG: dTDP-4-dehydrorhamnose reductase [Planctomycetota bacterium]|jgi:dTDP-4-dehydrorhamnose reductase